MIPNRNLAVFFLFFLLVGCTSNPAEVILAIPTVTFTTTFTPSQLPPTETATKTPSPTATLTLTPSPTATPRTITLKSDGSGDYVELPTAISNAGPGDTILLKKGTYILKEILTIYKPITLIGDGMDKTIIGIQVKQPNDGNVIFKGKGLFKIQGITFKDTTGKSGGLVLVEEGEIDFQECRFIGGQSEYSEALHIWGHVKGIVQNCVFETSFWGIAITNEARPFIKGNTIIKNDGGIYINCNAAPTLEDNIISQNRNAGIYYDGSFGGIQRGEAYKNQINENKFGIIVNDQAKPDLKINTISQNETGIFVLDQAKPTLEENLIFKNITHGIVFGGEAGGVAQKNQINENYFGIMVYGQSKPTLDENIISKNILGISFWDKASGIARNNQINENRSGIDVNDQAEPTLEENIISKNLAQGLYYDGESGGIARKNQINENKWAIFLQGQSKPILEGNVISNNKTGIQYNAKSGGVARNNEGTKNKICILIESDASPVLDKNICSNNEVGISISSTANPELLDNSWKDNSKIDIYDRRVKHETPIPTSTTTPSK